MEVYPAEFITDLDKFGPDGLEDALFDPALHGAMDRGVVGKLLRQVIPLHTGAYAIDDRIEGGALVDAFGTGIVGWVEFEQDRLNAIPEFVGHAPDRGQGLVFGASFHERLVRVERNSTIQPSHLR